MDARDIEPKETIPASRKLGAKDAKALAKAASKVIVAKRGKVVEWEPAGKAPKAMIDSMLGTTGNLRTPTLRSGKTVIVGFDEATYAAMLG